MFLKNHIKYVKVMKNLITNSNFKIEFSASFDLYLIAVSMGGIYKHDYRAALRYSFPVYSRILKKKFCITLLVYSTGSIIITNLPLLITHTNENFEAQQEICGMVFERIKQITKFAVIKKRRIIKLHGSKDYNSHELTENFGLCAFNNITLSFKSRILINKFKFEPFDKITDLLVENFKNYSITTLDERDYFPAAKLSVLGNSLNSVKINFTIYKDFGQVLITGVKCFSDTLILCELLKNIV